MISVGNRAPSKGIRRFHSRSGNRLIQSPKRCEPQVCAVSRPYLRSTFTRFLRVSLDLSEELFRLKFGQRKGVSQQKTCQESVVWRLEALLSRFNKHVAVNPLCLHKVTPLRSQQTVSVTRVWPEMLTAH